MRKEKVSHPLLLCIFAREQSPFVPTSVFLEERCPYSPSPVSLYYLGEPPRHTGCKQMPLSLLPTSVTAFFSTLEQPAHPACPPSRGSSSGAAWITRPTLSAAVKFPVKLRGDCRAFISESELRPSSLRHKHSCGSGSRPRPQPPPHQRPILPRPC